MVQCDERGEILYNLIGRFNIFALDRAADFVGNPSADPSLLTFLLLRAVLGLGIGFLRSETCASSSSTGLVM